MSDNFKFEAVIFDLDGVITKTALVHSSAWKSMFDEFLKKRANTTASPFKEFSQADYLKYVDGKPRYDGVKSFLESRNIDLPFGKPDDPNDAETVCGLGNRKNEAFNDVLKKEGVQVYDSTVALIHQLKAAGIRIGVASSSKNCESVLKSAGVIDLIETRVDGVVSAEMGLKGKPAPDIFTTAAANLGVKPSNAVVVEDATSGVAAGKSGNFGLVLGIAREENQDELYFNGADVVVDDLEEVDLEFLNEWFTTGIEDDNWSITYYAYEPEKERTREALLTVGNGYFGTRGVFEENNESKYHYPGTYIAGLYNRLITEISGKDIENEDFVNCPNWLPFTFKVETGNWLEVNETTLKSFKRSLDFRSGLLIRNIEVCDENGSETLIVSQRIASMADPHVAAMRYTIIPLNYSGNVTFKTGIDGTITNQGVERYKSLNQQHLKPVEEFGNDDIDFVLVETTQSDIEIATACTYRFIENYRDTDFDFVTTTEPGKVSNEFTVMLNQGDIFTVDKIATIATSKPDDTFNPKEFVLEKIANCGNFDDIEEASAAEWENIWNEIDIKIAGDRMSQKLLRLHLYHLIVSMSPHNRSIDASITARGLHGEAYRGHIFWDEVFVMPFYNLHLPETAKAMLMYRYNRLEKAKEYAAQYGYKGAMFPWQSGSDGREETQIIHLNPLSGSWDPDHSSLQRHVSLAVAWNIMNYFHISGDLQFIEDYGLEMFLEICRFWESKCRWNEARGKYDLTKVMGPDEFHEQYPDAVEGGLNNNAYTNLMAAWAFKTAKAFIDNPNIKTDKFFGHLGFTIQEIEHWQHIASNLYIDVNADGIIAQYEGYFDLKELDWDLYKQKYGNIYRMDRILKAEGLSPDEFKVSKQADFLMIYYLLDKNEVDDLLKNMNVSLPGDYLQRNLEYYFKRTSHGSTLSRVVHSKLALMAGNKELSNQLYFEALASDFNDIQGGTTAEGIHAGVMAGTVLLALQNYAGLDLNNEDVAIEPELPPNWDSIETGFCFKGIHYSIKVENKQVEISADTDTNVVIFDKKYEVPIDTNSRFTY